MWSGDDFIMRKFIPRVFKSTRFRWTREFRNGGGKGMLSTF
jgi:hypothetical protein